MVLVADFLLLLSTTAVASEPTRQGAEAFTEPYESIEVAASEPGRVRTVHVRRGSRVEAGALLLELDASVLEASRKVAAQRAGATARVEALRIDHQQKQRRYETIASLRRDGAVSPEELLSAESEMKIAALQVQAAIEELEQARLEVAEIEARVEQRRVRAPIAGIVTEVRREAGEFVSVSEPDVVTLVDLSRLRATFYLPTSEAVRLSEGYRAALLPAPGELADVAGPVAGVVEHIAPLTQADSGRVRVDVVIDNRLGQHRAGLRYMLSVDSTGPAAGNSEPTRR
ncbi:MAG: efflux RND transporter periplasmic adaptor subunit [Planctomycetaceae bacterium]|nr:efflux RND transporter periplasmic adaptor subunit [Planctomycetaceae bacterium]